jgi:catechol 2,3-dioxygenase-like lactoylglutathione lyase family enzyme
MGVRMSELVLDCRDPQRLADFWCEVLGFDIVGHEEDGSIEIGPAAGFGGLQPTIILGVSAEPLRARGRLHIDVSPVGDATRQTEVERILHAGGRHADVGQLGTEPWTVMQDPEGNVFCVLNAPIPVV